MEPTLYKRNPAAQKQAVRNLKLKFKDRSVALAKKFVIGRDPRHRIALPDDPLVSQNHALIELVDGIYYIQDLGSTNGTYVNKSPLPKGQKRALQPDDEILVGKTLITVAAARI